MKYLTAEEILVIHSEIIDKTGGRHGVRGIGLLMSIAEKPKSRFGGKELYEGVFKKAAVFFESIVQYHVFIDGNKRTGAVSAARFLFVNKYEMFVTNRELENFVTKVAVDKLGPKTISTWLKGHSRKIKS
ncbi:MAG: type II toxin-antitoxin system death-on-curing family toxin [Candidatus Zambryskibacteria bacterium CG_4_9_14_3_um_filter_42_9]|uniref:Type II toxin-antitoxin system death-on-curing family toxin n=1 Tax=Candidatus Zambryskibacteria bacterium CG22_combo_CG10-13_8_21_14_all_42_17 TaxID=1975118 RepID=A0A2H0BDS0_9BACT|nr:MAG: type II toxin-antitoxin system death-on-curing family toxin [Candidatus Zambryskibacteria bacterium CG22_combo_CG10-13_8_21_14_all_42_17]PJA36690.1 MAG: type II toxin-antitoxin system death-on-curing family toxin [Candidatus Zambryskibacteria bacterium CG_4_9_14_3_um_filter_42_9]